MELKPFDPVAMIEASERTLARALETKHITETGASIVRYVIKEVAAVVARHTTCGAGAYTMYEAAKLAVQISALVSAFEAHTTEDHGPAAEPKLTSADAAVEQRDNIIHMDLSKGKKH